MDDGHGSEEEISEMRRSVRKRGKEKKGTARGTQASFCWHLILQSRLHMANKWHEACHNFDSMHIDMAPPNILSASDDILEHSTIHSTLPLQKPLDNDVERLISIYGQHVLFSRTIRTREDKNRKRAWLPAKGIQTLLAAAPAVAMRRPICTHSTRVDEGQIHSGHT